MRIRLLITLCCVLFLSDHVYADGEGEIKKGHYSYMAFVYYPDESVVESNGLRFLRGAVLVKPEWLITSAIWPVIINDTPTGFPRKTLLARLGSVSIDANFTLNEDEDEQEREIIQIIRPYNQSMAEWWRRDVNLLKTLLPFNLTSTVGIATIRTRHGIISNSNCFMLIYSMTKKFGNWTEERVLMQILVELHPPSHDCGNNFHEDTMLCASDSEENKSVYDMEFCQSNSGGPLICENEVTGLQTYIENSCKPPHLYQLLSAWDRFITCGIESKCNNDDQCENTCVAINKDEQEKEDIKMPEEIATVLEETTATTEESPVHLVSLDVITQTEQITIPSYTTAEMITEEYDTPTRVPTHTPAMEQRVTVDTTTTTATTIITEAPTTSMATESRYEDVETTSSWPKDKHPEHANAFEESDDIMKIERKTNMEAQKHNTVKAKKRSAAERIMPVPLSLLVQFVLASLFM